MCGIAGIIAPDPTIDNSARIRAMLQVQLHRGPDGQGIATSGAATFGVNRLAIVDPRNGAQPMRDDSAQLLAYNGEIYNHAALRHELQRLGHVFRTQSDTEVVLLAHAAWGNDAMRRFDGMFAYALWNSLRQSVLLVRDRLGIKPLYWQQRHDGVAFASEIKGILALDGGKGDVDAIGLAEIFVHGANFPAGCGTSERTCFAGISAVLPAHVLELSAAGPRSQKWWSPRDEAQVSFDSREIAAEALEAAFVHSVRACRMGDAQVGASLSGGLDSSLITAELLAQSTEIFHAATITYTADRSDDDAAAATVVVGHLSDQYPSRLQHHWAYLPLDGYLDSVDALVQAFDEPCWEPRKLGMLLNYRVLHDAGCKVALSGEGADELFFGYYPRFAGWRTPPDMKMPADFMALWQQKLPSVRALLSPMFDKGLLRTADLVMITEDTTDAWLTPYWQAPRDRTRAVQLWYTHTFLHWLLADNDRFGMAASVEGRFPFLTQEMLQVAWAMPPEWNFPDEQGFPDKAMERMLGPSRLPPAIWRDRVKAPMPTPSSLRYHLAIADALEREIATARPAFWQLFSQAYLSKQISEFRATVLPLLATDPLGGERVAKYNPQLPVRTVHLFGALTTLRWFALYIR